MENIWVQVANEAWEARNKRKHFEKLEQNLFNALRILSDNKPQSQGGFEFKYIVRKGPIDYSSIQELKRINLEQYRKPDVLCWKLER